MKLRVLSALEKCFWDEKIENKTKTEYFSMLKNEKFSFQVAYQFNAPGAEAYYFSVKPKGELSDYLTIKRVQNVPVMMTHMPQKHDDFHERKTPGLYPDMLLPVTYQDRIKILPEYLHALWVDVEFPFEGKDIKSGIYKIEFIMYNSKGEEIAETYVNIEVIDALLPEIDFKRTEWFHCDCLAEYYEVPVFSDRHFEIIEEFMETAAQNEINTLMMPVFTPALDTYVGGERLTCQLVDVFLDNGTYSFDFSKVDRWISLCKKHNICNYEIPHFFTQWGAEKAPKIMAWVNGEYKKLFGWETDALSEEYVTFLDNFIPALLERLRFHKVDQRTIFHISDEPHIDHLEHYKAVKAVVERHLQGYSIMDAISNLDFFKQGVLKKSIINVGGIKQLIEEGMENPWVYYCGGDCVDVSNRFISMPSSRQRIIGIQMFKYDVKGFLHWGYNYYHNQYSYDFVNPFAETSGEYFGPAGDMFLVYPGKGGKPIPTMRLKTLRDAIQDYRALQLCKELCGEETAKAFIDEELDYELDFKKYPKTPDYILKLRNKVNLAIKNAVKEKQN